MQGQSIFYHYCSFDAFRSILNEKTLKFSDITKSNDHREISFLWDKYSEYIERAMRNNMQNPEPFKREIAKQLERTNYLAICLSELPDSLHMWNCYADGGIAIGFDGKAIDEWCRRIFAYKNALAIADSPLENPLARFEKIRYFSIENIDKYVDEQCSGKEFITDSFADVYNTAPFAKSDFFSSEAEWRIVVPFVNSPADAVPDCVDAAEPVKLPMRAGPNEMFPVCLTCRIPFEADMIKEIRIGPNCPADVRDIRNLLLVNGFDSEEISIRLSKGSYR